MMGLPNIDVPAMMQKLERGVVALEKIAGQQNSGESVTEAQLTRWYQRTIDGISKNEAQRLAHAMIFDYDVKVK
ncbi:hypothetical protein HWC80_gp077 [Mycobacterium phage Indlulamithi]|uniref:Uncharacterized protein n=1 Tax=Mycobacterium phage Indlulamithi TaxID=2656582 RepID=A0A649VDI0_9CAUD|nr:hypothetical protein HWC80_gp077 [Mycobacterium phage Indlulamithi]QGJ90135.1 hypothetical protein PBI_INDLULAMITHI_97 [Mycobacterium phage Indlulamithi]